MARLGTALAFSSPDRTRAETLGRGAVEMARRLGDQPTLHFSLNCCICAVWGPDSLDERLAISSELAQLSTEIGTAPNRFPSCRTSEEAGDLAGARARSRAARSGYARLAAVSHDDVDSPPYGGR